MTLRMRIATAILAATVALPATEALAGGEVNLYSSRHYDTDERLYSDFEDATGIRINRIEGNADELIERLKAEGRNSPADVLITVDAGRIWRAADAGLLSPVDSKMLEERIPAALQHPDNLWFGFSTRARIIFYAKDRVSEPPQTYDALADPKYKDQICIRSGLDIYNLSLLASRIAEEGPEKAEAWAEGLKNNLARQPQGGDIDQLRGLVSGECDIAVANTYYFARTPAHTRWTASAATPTRSAGSSPTRTAAARMSTCRPPAFWRTRPTARTRSSSWNISPPIRRRNISRRAMTSIRSSTASACRHPSSSSASSSATT